MAIIERKVRLLGSRGEYEGLALFDSGASVSCIRPEIAVQMEQPQRLYVPLRIATAAEDSYMDVREFVTLQFCIEGHWFASQFYLVPGLSEEVIIGAATMQQWRFKLDFEKEEVIIDPRVTRMRI
jgi:hypothetical protein